jgi:hypothetical protein
VDSPGLWYQVRTVALCKGSQAQGSVGAAGRKRREATRIRRLRLRIGAMTAQCVLRKEQDGGAGSNYINDSALDSA